MKIQLLNDCCSAVYLHDCGSFILSKDGFGQFLWYSYPKLEFNYWLKKNNVDDKALIYLTNFNWIERLELRYYFGFKYAGKYNKDGGYLISMGKFIPFSAKSVHIMVRDKCN